jgi:DNA-directed RNA polymerase specialized sigma24 family protein
MDAQELMNHLKKGDDKILAGLYIQYRNDFISYAVEKFKMDIDILKEIYHNTLIQFSENIQTGRLVKFNKSVKSYLFEIGNDLIYMKLKKLDKEYLLKLGIKKKVIRAVYKHEQLMENEGNYKIIKDEFAKLDEQSRSILSMYYYDKEKAEDIIQTLQIEDLETARNLKFNAFEKLKKAVLSKPGYDK